MTKEKPLIHQNSSDKFITSFFLPENQSRKGEGGLRTKGYFKKSFKEAPLISIISVVYNGQFCLEETIQSVIKQNYENIEYIIIDGGSTDGTLNIIRKYEDKLDYWVSENDNGIYDAMNKGIGLATGEWVNFMNAGDNYYDKWVLHSVAENTNFDLVYGKAVLKSNDSYDGIVVGEIVNKDDFYFKMPICHQAIFYKLKLFKSIGRFCQKLRISADHEWMLRAFIDGRIKISFIDKIFCDYTVDGFSRKNALKSIKEIYHIANKYFNKKHNCIKYFSLILRTYLFLTVKKIGLLRYFRFIKSVFNKKNQIHNL